MLIVKVQLGYLQFLRTNIIYPTIPGMESVFQLPIINAGVAQQGSVALPVLGTWGGVRTWALLQQVHRQGWDGKKIQYIRKHT